MIQMIYDDVWFRRFMVYLLYDSNDFWIL